MRRPSAARTRRPGSVQPPPLRAARGVAARRLGRERVVRAARPKIVAQVVAGGRRAHAPLPRRLRRLQPRRVRGRQLLRRACALAALAGRPLDFGLHPGVCMRAPSVHAASACARACYHGCLPVAQRECMYRRMSPCAQPWAQQHQHWEQRPAGWFMPAPRHTCCIGRPAAAFVHALKDATRRAPAPWPRRRARGARGRTPHPPRSARPRPPWPPRGRAARPSAAPGHPPRPAHTLRAPRQTTLAPSSAQSCTPHELLRRTCALALPSTLAAAECEPVKHSQQHSSTAG
jgi:hypothetical protein